MFKPKKSDRRKKPKKTPLEIEEEQSRTLYVRLPHTIKSVDEVKNLFFGDFRVKKPRQSTRYCHVIFTDLEGKIKNLKAVKDKTIGEKPIYIGPPKPINIEKKMKPKQKKIKVPEPKAPEKVNKYLFISNIAPGVKASELKDAFPGAKTVALLKGLVHGKRTAKLKMSSPQLCSYYTGNKDNWPVIKDQKVYVTMSKNSKKNEKKKKTQSLKVSDGNSKAKKGQSKIKGSNSKNVSIKSTQEDDDSEEEEDTEEEGEGKVEVKEKRVKEEEEDEDEDDEEDEEEEDEDEDEEEEEDEDDEDEEEVEEEEKEGSSSEEE